MQQKNSQTLALLGNLLIFTLLLYIFKTIVGIDIFPRCHVEEVFFGTCESTKDDNKNLWYYSLPPTNIPNPPHSL